VDGPWRAGVALGRPSELRERPDAGHDHHVRDRLPDAPWWVHSIIGAVVTGGMWALAAWLAHWFSSPAAAGIAGGLAGVASGAAAARERARVWDEVSPMPSAGKAAVVHAAHRGPVPEDPALREAARQLLAEELDMRQRRSRPVLAGLAVLAIVVMLSSGSDASWVLGVVVAVLFVGDSWTRRRWAQRLLLLGSGLPAVAVPDGLTFNGTPDSR
jgi:hypothetical protein